MYTYMKKHNIIRTIKDHMQELKESKQISNIDVIENDQNVVFNLFG